MNQKLFGILYVSGILVAGVIANELYKHSKFGKQQQAESEKYHQEAEEGLKKIMDDFMKEKPTDAVITACAIAGLVVVGIVQKVKSQNNEAADQPANVVLNDNE